MQVDYEPLVAIFTIKDAIEKNSFYSHNDSLQFGEFDDKKFLVEDSYDRVIEGEMQTGAQEHLYLETNGSLEIPKGEIMSMKFTRAHSATQIFK